MELKTICNKAYDYLKKDAVETAKRHPTAFRVGAVLFDAFFCETRVNEYKLIVRPVFHPDERKVSSHLIDHEAVFSRVPFWKPLSVPKISMQQEGNPYFYNSLYV